jgi:photosystem II stability/assembly factor-like uncharacterized protein
MKKFTPIVFSFLIIGVLVGVGIFTLQTNAGWDFTLFGEDPDMPGFLQKAKKEFTKEEFMTKRSEAIAEKRGVEKDKPFDPQNRVKAIRKMEQQETERTGNPDSLENRTIQAAWTEIGPNPIPNGQVVSGSQLAVSGRVSAISVHPTNADIIYVGTAQGGLYRTTDGGTTWTPLTESALSLAIGAVAISPSDPETVYVGTGEPTFSNDGYFGVGIYRIDGASTTATLSGPFNSNGATDVMSGRAVSEIQVHPTDKNIIFATTVSGIGGILAASPAVPVRGLFRSTNAAGATPTFTKLGVPTGIATEDRAMSDLIIDPVDANKVIVAVISTTANNSGVWTSSNGLAATPTFTRTLVNVGTSPTTARTEFAVSRGGGVTTFFAGSALNGGTVHRSTDGGNTWVQQIDNNFCGGQCFYNIAIEADPTDANNVYAGGVGTSLTFIKSTNAGVAFTSSAGGLHTDTHAIAVAPSSPSTIYFGSDGGIYKSTDSGTTWATLNNTTFRATQFMSLDVHAVDSNFTIGGTQDNGTECRNTAGVWTRCDFGDGGYAVVDQSFTSTTTLNLYHTYFNASTLTGYGFAGTSSATEGTWAFRGCQGVTANGITCTGTINFYAPLERGPGSPNSVYYGADRLYRTVDTGLNHTTVSQTFASPISAIGISPQNDNIRIIGQNNGGIFGTTTASATLLDLDPTNVVPNSAVARAVIDPTNINTAYVTLSAFGVVNVWKTTTLSSSPNSELAPTWTAAAGSGGTALPQVPVNAIVIDPLNSSKIYVGTDIGVYFSPNGGGSWTPLGTGLPRVAVFDMAITPNRTLRIATHGRGMWDIPIFAPTASNAAVRGRVVTPSGRGLLNAFVSITNTNTGEVLGTRTTSFGYFNFQSLAVGSTYTIQVRSKRYEFDNNTFTLNEDLTDLILTGR